MANRVIDRLDQYITFKKINRSNAERTLGIANGYIRNQLAKNGSIGSDIIENILKKFIDLDINWLITGEGEMIRKPSPNPSPIPSPTEQSVVKQGKEYPDLDKPPDIVEDRWEPADPEIAWRDRYIKVLEEKLLGQDSLKAGFEQLSQQVTTLERLLQQALRLNSQPGYLQQVKPSDRQTPSSLEHMPAVEA